jgi:UDP-N-acetyl-D-galactosamine dehydrogenase
VGKALKKGDIVIYESTVYPGVTEDECIPVLERESGLTFNTDFFAGYSPERINPGDKERTVKKILKITSGSTPEIADTIDALYRSVIVAGTHKAPSIKVAEAAKVIENSQRDINIAFVNELAKIFNRLNIDTHAVLEAAGTKWNFLPFKPGLVGGHCIGVDPYYLAQKAQETGYHPEIILAGRRLNDGMGEYVANEVIFKLVKKGHVVAKSRVLVLGITFKENCPDLRNSRVVDVIRFRAAVAFMPQLATRLLLPAFLLRLLVGSFLAGRTGRIVPTTRGRSVPVAVGEDLGLCKQGKDHGLLAEGENGSGLFFGQVRP